MQLNLFIMIGIGLATMFFGYGFGLFEGRGQGYKKRKKEEAEEKKIQPPVSAPPAAPKENNLLRLIMDNGNQLRLEVDGQRADAAQLAPEQRKRIIDLLMKLRPWIDASASKPSAAPQPVAARPIPSTPIATSDLGRGPFLSVCQSQKHLRLMQCLPSRGTLANTPVQWHKQREMKEQRKKKRLLFLSRSQSQ